MSSDPIKLFTLTVEDSSSSSEDVLLRVAQEAAEEYAAIYQWENIQVVPSEIQNEKSGNMIFYFYDVYGIGEPQVFDPKRLL